MIMENILTKACEALTGMLDRDYGYYIRRAPHKDGKVRFFGQRSKWSVPPDGHLRFILKCAELAQMKMHIVDIQVSVGELDEALEEATEGMVQTPWAPSDAIVNAEQVLKLKQEYKL